MKALPLSGNVSSHRLEVRNLSLVVAGTQILDRVALTLPATGISVLIGPSGAGKSSLLRCLNRLWDHWEGEVLVDDQPVSQWPGGGDALRRHLGLIGQKPVVFPGSIRANVLFGLGRRQRRTTPLDRIEEVLGQAGLWREVGERLDRPAASLSLGQQQRLCIARALMLDPAILMVDEPTSSLDPSACRVIERTLLELAGRMPLLWVTHDLAQARRVAEQVVFLCQGRVVEEAPAEQFFSHPKKVESREFLRWHVCDCEL